MEGDFEIIVVDGGSTDDTVGQCRDFPEVVVLEDVMAQKAAQMNRGAAEAASDALLFLHADTIPPADFVMQITLALSDRQVIGGSFYLRFDRDHWILDFVSWITRFNISWITAGDHGIFIRKSEFQALGGYRDQPLFEDFDLQRRMRRKGRFVRQRSPVYTSARRFVRNGVLKQVLKDGMLLLAYYLGFSPRFLAGYYPDEEGRTA